MAFLLRSTALWIISGLTVAIAVGSNAWGGRRGDGDDDDRHDRGFCSMDDRVEELEDQVMDLEDCCDALMTAIMVLDQRVAALEGDGGGGDPEPGGDGGTGGGDPVPGGDGGTGGGNPA